MSCIEYNGSVTIVKKLRGKYLKTEHYHNNGTKWLFNYLCKYLWDGSTDSDGVPQYLDIIKVDGEGKSVGSILTAPVYNYPAEGTRQPATVNDYPYIKKKFYIGSNNLIADDDDGNTGSYELYMVLLHSSGSTDYLATIPLRGSDNKPLTKYDIKEGESHEIYWKMEFVNPEMQVVNPEGSNSEGENS